MPWVRRDRAAAVRSRAGPAAVRSIGVADHGEGIAIELVLDISGSMEALDFQSQGRDVSRLTAVKQVVRDLCSDRGNRPARTTR